MPIVLLAAGEGRRLGQCKPLVGLGGQSLLEHAVYRLRPLTSRLVVVLGYQSLRVRLQTRVQPHLWVVNADWQHGQSSSLQAGLMRLDGAHRGALVCLVDQPRIPTRHYRELLQVSQAAPGRTLATRVGSRLMAPAYIPRILWPDVFKLRGDQGARSLLAKDGDALECDAASDDIDTRADLLRHRSYLQF